MPRLLLFVFTLVLAALPLRAQTVYTVTLTDGQKSDTDWEFTTYNPATLIFTIDSGTAYQRGDIIDQIAVVKEGAGTLILSGVKTPLLGTTLNAGTLGLTAAYNLYRGDLTINGGTLASFAGAISLANNVTLGGDFTLGAGLNFTGSVTLADDITLTSGGAAIDGTIGGAHALTIAGGSLRLGGNNTYTGGTTVTSTATLQLGNGGTSGSIVGDIANAGTVVFNRSDASTFAGVISGSGSVAQSGSGTLTLTSANTYTGGTTLNSGTLALGADDALGSGTLTVNGGTLRASGSGRTLTNAVILAGDFTLGRLTNLAGAITLTKNITLTSANPDSGDATTSTLSGVISGNYGLTFADGTNPTGTIVLSAANTFTGATVLTSGTLALGHSLALQASTFTYQGGVLDFGSLTSATFGGLSGNQNLALTNASSAALALTVGGNQASTAFSGALTGTGSLTKTGSGTLTLTGANTYSGGTTVNAGLIAFNTLASFGSGALTLNGGGLQWATGNTTDISARLSALGSAGASFDTNGNTVTFLTALSGSGSLTKSGSGSLILASDNTYSGGTTISAGTLQIGAGGTSGSIVGNIANAGAVVFNRSDASTFAGVISGSGSVAQSGSGTLTLTSANTYSGGTTLNSGTLALGADNALGSGTLTLNGGTLRASGSGRTLTNAVVFAGDFTLGRSTNLAGAITLTKTVTLTSANPDSGNATTSTLSGVISGNYGLTFVDGSNPTGKIILAGNNTYTGSTTLLSGTLQIGAGGTTGSVAGNIANAGTLIFNRSDALVYAGAISGTGSLTQAGAGTLTLTGANTHSGGTTVSSGTLQIGNGGTTGSIAGDIIDNAALIFNRSNALAYAGAISGTGSLTKLGAGTLTLSGTNTYSGGTTVNAGLIAFTSLANLGSGALTLNGGGLQWAAGNTTDISAHLSSLGSAGAVFDTNGNSVTFSSTLSGSGSLTKSGSGSLILASDNTYSGGTVLNGGTLAISSVGALGSGGLTFNGGTLLNSAALSLSSAITLASGGGTFATTGGDVTLAGLLSGAGGLTKTGGNALTLTAANTYTGGTTLSGGTLTLSGAGTLGSGTLYLTNGATLDLGGSTQTLAGLGSSSTRLSGNLTAGTIATIGNVYLQSGTFAATFTGSSSGGRLWIGGDSSATIYLNGTNNAVYTTDHNQVIIGYATTGAAGTVQLGNANALAAATENVELWSGTLDLNGQTDVRAKTLVLKSGASSVLINRSTTSAASFAGGVTLSSAGSQIGGAGNLTLSGALSGSGGLSKIGAGTLTLAGTNTYSGVTAINAGKLVVNGSLTSSSVTVNSGATLGGSGSVGTLVIASGATLAPGNSPGTLTAGNTTFAGGGTFQLELNDASGAAGTNWDVLAINGALTFNATSANPFTLDLTSLTLANLAGAAANFDSTSDYSFTFLTTTGGVSGFSSDAFAIATSHFSNPFSGTWSVSLTNSGRDLTLNYAGSAIPEPATYAALAGLAALGLAALRRRQRAWPRGPSV